MSTMNGNTVIHEVVATTSCVRQTGVKLEAIYYVNNRCYIYGTIRLKILLVVLAVAAALAFLAHGALLFFAL